MLSDMEFAEQFEAALHRLGNSNFTLSFTGQAGEDDSTLPALRMSAMGKCARRLYYQMTSTEANWTSWPSLMGYAGQSLVTKILFEMGYLVRNIEGIVRFHGIIGHVDGELTGLDLDGVATWDCKLRSTYGYRQLARIGLPKADPEMYLQQQGYIAATGADMGIVTVHPFDFSENRSQISRFKGNEDVHPLVTRIVLEPDPVAHQLIADRKDMLTLAHEAGVLVAREYDPVINKFPCDYCPNKDTCVLQGQTSDMVVAPIPVEWKPDD